MKLVRLTKMCLYRTYGSFVWVNNYIFVIYIIFRSLVGLILVSSLIDEVDTALNIYKTI